jgi:hypothetical protein
MKTLIPFLLLFPFICFGQSPQGVNYQAVAYDSDGFELSNKEVGVRISIIEGSAFGIPQLVEEHDVLTTEQGLFSLIIGQGALLGGEVASLLDIPWGSNTYFLKIELDTENNGSYMDFGTQQFMSVPYALYAESSGAVGPEGPEGPPGEPADSVDYDFLANMISIDSTFLASVTGGLGGCNFQFPEGFDGEPVTAAISVSNPYIVPEGKRLYVIVWKHSQPQINNLSGPSEIYGANTLVLNSGEALHTYDANTFSYMSGLLVNETQNLVGVSADISASNPYVVPEGKRLYVLSWGGGSPKIDNLFIFDIAGGKPLIVNSGQLVYPESDNSISRMNGYLADENYFAGCGGGGGSSSASNATIDSLSQVVSNLDSSLTALTSQINFGCTDPSSCNYDSTANLNDGSCTGILGCTDSTATNYNSLATCDDGSCTALAIGDTYHGGIVFYLDGIGGGLTAAIGDQSTSTSWGCYGTIITGADGTAIGTGNQNTIDIEAECTSSGNAADLCANLILSGYNDWFLPSRDELELMYLNLHSQGLGSFSNDYYWSSSEWGPNDSWYVYFLDGTVSYLHPPIHKGDAASVRAVRAF